MSDATATQDATPANDTLTARARENGMDMDAVLTAYREADASAGNVLGGVWGHEAFCRAIHGFLGTGRSDDSTPVVMDTDFYDMDKSVGGDGHAGAVDKRRCNTVRKDARQHVAVTKVHLRDAEMVGRFMALADEMGWAIEWGFDKRPRAHSLSVVVAPSDNLDY